MAPRDPGASRRPRPRDGAHHDRDRRRARPRARPRRLGDRARGPRRPGLTARPAAAERASGDATEVRRHLLSPAQQSGALRDRTNAARGSGSIGVHGRLVARHPARAAARQRSRRAVPAGRPREHDGQGGSRSCRRTSPRASSRGRRLQQAWRMRAKHVGHESMIVLDEHGERAGHLVVDHTLDAVHLLWLALLRSSAGRVSRAPSCSACRTEQPRLGFRRSRTASAAERPPRCSCAMASGSTRPPTAARCGGPRRRLSLRGASARRAAACALRARLAGAGLRLARGGRGLRGAGRGSCGERARLAGSGLRLAGSGRARRAGAGASARVRAADVGPALSSRS